jgi:hypothetical protein
MTPVDWMLACFGAAAALGCLIGWAWHWLGSPAGGWRSRAARIRWKYSYWPSFRIRMSAPARWLRHLLRRRCLANVTVEFGPLMGDDVIYRFECKLPRWHRGPCREQPLRDWTCGPTHRKPGEVRYDELNRRKFKLKGKR